MLCPKEVSNLEKIQIRPFSLHKRDENEIGTRNTTLLATQRRRISDEHKITTVLTTQTRRSCGSTAENWCTPRHKLLFINRSQHLFPA